MTTLDDTSSTRARALSSGGVLIALFTLLIACEEPSPRPAPPGATPTTSDAPAVPTMAIEGWSCDSPARCFGWHVGLSREYERRVGKARTRESWRIDDTEPIEGGGVRLRQSGGNVTQYSWRGDALLMTVRDEPLEMLRFPIPATPTTFEVDDSQGGKVRMYLEPLDEPVITPAGSFAPCLRHEARFVNEDTPGQVRLIIETHLCKGVGEVMQRVQLEGMPHDVERVLTGLKPSVSERTSQPPPQGEREG